jgi:hypothetical protein
MTGVASFAHPELALSAERRSRGSRLPPSVGSGNGAVDLAAAQVLSPLFCRLRAAGGDVPDVPADLEQLPEPPRLNILSRYAALNTSAMAVRHLMCVGI